jgi:hypothetical protein
MDRAARRLLVRLGHRAGHRRGRLGNVRSLRPAGSASGKEPEFAFCGIEQHLAERELPEEARTHRVELSITAAMFSGVGGAGPPP